MSYHSVCLLFYKEIWTTYLNVNFVAYKSNFEFGVKFTLCFDEVKKLHPRSISRFNCCSNLWSKTSEKNVHPPDTLRVETELYPNI